VKPRDNPLNKIPEERKTRRLTLPLRICKRGAGGVRTRRRAGAFPRPASPLGDVRRGRDIGDARGKMLAPAAGPRYRPC
jgi:hypothetical protein